MNIIRGALVEDGVAAFRDALERHSPGEVHRVAAEWADGRLERVVEALLDAGWRPPAPPEARRPEGSLSMAHTLVLGQRLTLIVEDPRTHALTEWTGTVTDVIGSGPVNMVQHVRISGTPRQIPPSETIS